MFEALAILLALALLLVLIGKYGAESRHDFLNPNRKHGPYLAPFRLRSR
jgi:hypothetical protein